MLILSCKKSNVFTVTFSTSNQYVYSCALHLDVTRDSEYSFSGGADDTVLKYDLSRYTTNRMEGDGPMQSYTQHSVSVDVVDYYLSGTEGTDRISFGACPVTHIKMMSS